MRKLKTLLLTLAGGTLFAAPLVAVQCNDDAKENTQDNQTKPEKEKAKETEETKEKAKETKETKVQDPELVDAKLLDGNELFELVPEYDKDKVLQFLKEKSNHIIQFDHNKKEITTNKKTGVAFMKFKPEYQASNVQPVNTENTTFTIKKSQKVYPNGNLSFSFDEKNGILTIQYKIAYKDANNTFKYTDKSYTTTIKLNEDTKPKATTISNNEHVNVVSNDTVDINTNVSNSVNGKYKYVYDDKNDYYAAADGKKGKELVDALLKIQKSHYGRVHGYGSLPNFYNSSKAFKDLFYEKDNSMLDVYSENPNGKDPYNFSSYRTVGGGHEGDGMNREHMIPQSWFGKESPMVSDVNHIFPTDIKVNNIRSNDPHDNVTSYSTTFQQGSKKGVNELGTAAMEPLDAFKGDIARAYLYFTVTYNDKNLNQKGNSIFTKAFPYIQTHYLNTYIKWTKNDAVDPWDVTRNNEIAKFQEVRNPFIDYPDLADSIFGNNPKLFVNKGVLIKAE
ncbi:endonuclease [Mycoplasma sp. CR]|uniref:endonuclease n=1 Tax=Mycoplasma sp. CR TaxID=3401693 RepID=UPI003AB08A06